MREIVFSKQSILDLFGGETKIDVSVGRGGKRVEVKNSISVII